MNETSRRLNEIRQMVSDERPTRLYMFSEGDMRLVMQAFARLERAARAALADIAVVNRNDGLHLDTEDALREALSHADPLFGIEDGYCSVGGMAADLGENVNDVGN